ncbi:MAG: hypothetical protein ACI35S_05225 [Anaeroplasma sp.]
MKNKLFVLMSFFIIVLFGCSPSEEKITACQINAEINLSESIQESLYLEKNNERFVWKRTVSENDWGHFYFSFSNNEFYYKNSTEFTYLDSSNETIVFTKHDGNEYYEFEGSMIIYIYYNNSSDEIKKIINSDTFYIEIGGNHWFSKPEIYNK